MQRPPNAYTFTRLATSLLHRPRITSFFPFLLILFQGDEEQDTVEKLKQIQQEQVEAAQIQQDNMKQLLEQEQGMIFG